IQVTAIVVKLQDPRIKLPFSLIKFDHTGSGSTFTVYLTSARLTEAKTDTIKIANEIVIVMMARKYAHHIFSALHGSIQVRLKTRSGFFSFRLEAHRGAFTYN